MCKVVPHGKLSLEYGWQLLVVALCHLCHYFWVVSHFCSFFSYHSLLELHYGDRLHKSQLAREQAIEARLPIREAEWRLDAKFFLDLCPRWKIEGPHWSIILHDMFLHAAKQVWKEAERFIWWGHWQSLPRPDPEADIPAIKLVGYQTSHKQIRDLYHSVYLLRWSPSPLPCGPQQRKEAIQDILSSLRNWLHRQGYPTTSKEDVPEAAAEPQCRPRRRENPHDEAFWEARETHQWALKAVHVLESDIERLS